MERTDGEAIPPRPVLSSGVAYGNARHPARGGTPDGQ